MALYPSASTLSHSRVSLKISFLTGDSLSHESDDTGNRGSEEEEEDDDNDEDDDDDNDEE